MTMVKPMIVNDDDGGKNDDDGHEWLWRKSWINWKIQSDSS